MHKFNYYWIDREGKTFSAGSDHNYGRWRYSMTEPLNKAKKVWVQGPKGGTQLVRAPWMQSEREAGYNYIGYITNIPEAMQEFAWVVLTATPLNIRI